MSKLNAIYSLPLIYVQHLRTCSDKFSSHHGNEVAKISIGLIFKVKRILNRCYDSMSHSVNTKTLKCRLKTVNLKLDQMFTSKQIKTEKVLFQLQVLIFDRPIKDCPLFFDVTDHNPPLITFGSHGCKEKGFMQPCGVAIDGRNNVFVIDTGNSRVKKLTPNLDFVSHITNEGLEGRSVTGICMGSSLDSLVSPRKQFCLPVLFFGFQRRFSQL